MAGDGEHEAKETEIEMKKDNENIINKAMSRKEKRKALKKMRRKQLRRENAIKVKHEEEARLNDPEEQLRLLRLEQEEAHRMERDRIEFEERERRFLRELELKKQEEECKDDGELVDNANTNELNEGNDWDYVEDGPAEIIWKGNEIIVKKKKVRVPKKCPKLQIEIQESERPISNPLAPQSEAYEDYRSAQEVLESVAQQVPNFGTEQDKAHCPFHLKTGVCRFGARCSRVHFYPDKSCTLLMKNMYNGPGLAFEQDEGLEYTDEEVERSFEDFYEDVHTEFLKFGEIVNFKVCKNASSHLRGNVYVHFKLLESALLAYQTINGRYFAGKQITCEFVNLTRWKVAICGEYMKSRLKSCSRGSTCNFIHCFRNPGGDYEWADLDKPAPRYWIKKMDALFGHASDRFAGATSPGRYLSRRSQSRGSNNGNFSDDDDRRRGILLKRRGQVTPEDKRRSHDNTSIKHRVSDDDVSDGDFDDNKFSTYTRRSSKKRGREPESPRQGTKSRRHETYSDRKGCSKKGESVRYMEHKSKSLGRHRRMRDFDDSSHRGNNSRPKKIEEEYSDVDSGGDRLNISADRYHGHSIRSSRKAKKEDEVSDGGSHGSSLARDEKRHQKSERKVSRSKSDAAADGRNREKLDKEEEYHRKRRRSSRHHSKNKLAIIDSDAREHSIDKHKPREKGDSCSYESHARHRNSRDDSEWSLVGEDKVDGTPQTSGCRDSVSYATDLGFQEDNVSRYIEGDRFCDSCMGNRKSKRHRKSYEEERRPQIGSETKEGNAASHGMEAVDRHGSSPDIYGQSEAELEKAYRLAALKKLDELKKSKDTPVMSKGHDETTEIHSYDNLLQNTEVGKDVNELCSSKMDKIDAHVKRRRI